MNSPSANTSPRYLASPRPTLEMVRKMNKTIGLWAVFFLVVGSIFTLCSDGDFSFLMTFAAFTRTFGFSVLFVRMFVKKHAKGVSKKTLQMYSLVFMFRLASILRHEGYLPYDKSGDFVYHIAEGLSLGLALSCLLLIETKYARSYQRDYDNFGVLHVPHHLGILWLVVPCFLLALILHPSLNREFVTDTAWALSMYLESCAIVPQLYMFQKQAKGVVEVLIGHSVFALGFSRVLDMIFWAYSYHELSGATNSSMVGPFVLLTQFVHIAIMGDFFYYYIVSLRTGEMMQLPAVVNMV